MREVKKTLWSWKEAARDRLRMELAGRFGPMPTPERWVFAVGCTNSGTTLLHDILAQHPDAGTMPEDGHFLSNQLLAPWDVGLQRVWGTRPDLFRLTEADPGGSRVRRLKRQWAAQYDDPTRPVLLEKTPPNALRMRWLQEHFENAHFISIIRHPYAVVEGIHRKGGWPIELSARQWRETNEMMLSDAEHLHRWMLVRYEDLTERTDEVVGEVATFIALDPDRIDTDRTWRPIGGWDREIQNRNAATIDRLSDVDRATVRREAEPLMERFGYGEGPEA